MKYLKWFVQAKHDFKLKVADMANLLFICGSLNQTTQMHQIAQQLSEFACFYSPFYADGIEDFAARQGWLDRTALGGRHRQDTLQYLHEKKLPLDYRGVGRRYDLVVTCSDLILPGNIQHTRLVLIQEGITVPEGFNYQLVRNLNFLPRYIANTAATGLSDRYDLFCVASEGYRELFIHKGVRPEKIAVTGIPNFDNLLENTENSFPYHGHVLVATTPFRENMQFENRYAFLQRCVQIAGGRQLIFKLHPLENFERARREILRVAPQAFVFTSGNVNPMIANAAVVITQQSTCTYVALALHKEVYSQLDINELKRLMPLQNNGDSARRIATLCQKVIHTPMPVLEAIRKIPRTADKSTIGMNKIPRGRWETVE
jgi:hypothetical protein